MARSTVPDPVDAADAAASRPPRSAPRPSRRDDPPGGDRRGRRRPHPRRLRRDAPSPRTSAARRSRPPPGNLHATGVELRWLDFEDVCRGPVGYDLALLCWMDPAAGDGWADPEQLALCSDLRAVYLALCPLAFRDAFGDDPAWDGIRGFLQQVRRPPSSAP